MARKKTGSKSGYRIGIDIGGTKILAVLFNSRYEPVARSKVKVDANDSRKNFISSIYEATSDVLKQKRIKMTSVRSVGVGCAGMVDEEKGLIKMSPNLLFLNRYNLGDVLSRHFRKRVHIENDVNAGLYGEYQLGAGKGKKHVVGIFPGTGVGGALILDGHLYRGAAGAAGEVGHMFLSTEGMIYGGNSVGTLEALIGRLKIASEASYLSLRQKAPALLKHTGSDLKKIKSKALKRALDSGDDQIAELIDYKSKLLGIAMANLANILNPEMFILGGGVVEAMEKRIVSVAEKTMKQYGMPPNVAGVSVKAARLGDDAVAAGAAILAEEYR